MDHSENPWVLRVLTGPHKDAMIELEIGQTSIGSSDECDYVFDALLAQHFTLSITDDGTHEIETHSNELHLNGSLLEAESAKIHEGDILNFEELYLAFGYEESNWDAITEKLNDSPAIEQEPPDEIHDETNSNDTELTADLETDKVARAPSKNRSSRAKVSVRSIKRLMIPIAIFTVALTIAIFTLLEPQKTVAEKPNTASLATQKSAKVIETKEELLELLNQALSINEIDAEYSDETTTWSFIGYVSTQQDKEDLQSWVSDINERMQLQSPEGTLVTVADATKVTESFVSNIQDALNQYGYMGLKVSGTDIPGEMRVSGALQTYTMSQELDWQEAFKKIKQDLPHIKMCRNEVALERMVETPNLVVHAVSLGKHPYFVDDNGKRYFVGSIYQGRYRIESITMNSIFLAYQKKIIEYQL